MIDEERVHSYKRFQSGSGCSYFIFNLFFIKKVGVVTRKQKVIKVIYGFKIASYMVKYIP